MKNAITQTLKGNGYLPKTSQRSLDTFCHIKEAFLPLGGRRGLTRKAKLLKWSSVVRKYF